MSLYLYKKSNTSKRIAFALTSFVMCAAVISSFSLSYFAANADAEPALLRTMNSASIKEIERCMSYRHYNCGQVFIATYSN